MKKNRMKKVNLVFVIALFVVACNNSPEKSKADNPAVSSESAAQTKENSPAYTVEMVDNKKDFVCGMPVTAGIGDTAHYKGKVYGFCSKECKDDFLKNPMSYLAKK